MINKKVKILCAALMAASLSLIAVGCQGGGNSSGGGTSGGTAGGNGTQWVEAGNGATATLDGVPASRDFIIGETALLSPTYTRVDGYSMRYTSSDPSVVTVSRLGEIEAVGVGEATITVQYSDGTNGVTKECAVTVSLGQYVPTLNVSGEVNGKVSMTKDTSYTIQTYVDYMNKAFQGAQLTYEIDDETVATIDETGKITPIKTGTAEIRIKGTWNGATLDTCTVALEVMPSVVFLNNGEAFESVVTLYTTATFAGKSYRTTMDNMFTVSVDGGSNYDANVEFETAEGESIATLGFANITAKTYGTTQVRVYKEINGKTYERTFELRVERPFMTVSETVPLFATNLGTWVDEKDSNARKGLLEFDAIKNNLIDGANTLVDVYQDGKKLTFDNATGVINGVTSSKNSERGTATLTIGTAKTMYEVKMETLGNVVYSVDDLVAMGNSGVHDNYWELQNNIDATGKTITNTSSSFTGTFNGNGYTISNLTLAENSSLFGSGSKTSVVKNLALKNLTATKAYYFFTRGAGDGTTIDNVYIQLSSATTHPRGLVSYSGDGGMQVFTSVLIEYNSSIRYDSEYGSNQGVLIGDLSITNPGTGFKTFNGEKRVDREWVNVFVVSKYVLSYNPTQMQSIVNGGTVYEAVGVYGANETKDLKNNAVVAGTYNNGSGDVNREHSAVHTDDGKTYYNVQLQKAYRYDTLADMTAKDTAFSKADLSTFNSEFWTTSTSKGAKTLVWRGRQA